MARLVFLGTPEVAVGPLETLVACVHEVVGVVTRPDRRRARGGPPVPSPVKAAALRGGLEVVEEVTEVLDGGAELGVVVAYGRIIPVAVLERLPMVNLHFSLLPRWRGAAPVERAILAGDERTGVCLMTVEPELDTGPVHACAETAIGADETADELRGRLADLGSKLLAEHLAGGRAGLPPGRPQVGETTYAAKVEPAERRLRFELPADVVNRTVRIGQAWTTFRGARLLVRRAVPATAPEGSPREGVPGELWGTHVRTGGGGWLRLDRVQPQGRTELDAAAWVRGARPAPGERLGGEDPAGTGR